MPSKNCCNLFDWKLERQETRLHSHHYKQTREALVLQVRVCKRCLSIILHKKERKEASRLHREKNQAVRRQGLHFHSTRVRTPKNPVSNKTTGL